MEEEIEDEFYCGEPIEEKKRGFTEEYKNLMRNLTSVHKEPEPEIFRRRPIFRESYTNTCFGGLSH